jgi:hypothetical protein
MKINRLYFIVIVGAFLFAVLSCDSYTGIEGRVLDEKGNAISGAKLEVEFEDNKKETVTDETGFYSVSEAHFPLFLSETIKISACKEGYQPYEQKIVSKSNPTRIKRDIILKQS